jgi:hypothetical protein
MQKCPRPPAIRLDRVHAVPNSPRVSDAIATVNRIADAEIAAAEGVAGVNDPWRKGDPILAPVV